MNDRNLNFSYCLSLALVAIFIFGGSASFGADNLKLKNGISFVQDTDNGFPIIGDNMEDVQIATTKGTLIFFGAAGDLNTNRQAKRVVDLYKKFQDKIKVIVVDVDHPANADAVKLIKTYYKGYIPTTVVLDKTGRVSASHSGEVEANELKSQIERVL